MKRIALLTLIVLYSLRGFAQAEHDAEPVENTMDELEETSSVMGKTMDFTSEILRLTLEMMTADEATRDSLEKVIEQRSKEFEKEMEQVEQQIEEAREMQKGEDADATHIIKKTTTGDSVKITVLNIPSEKSRKKTKAKVKKPSRVRFRFPSAIEFSKGIPMYNGAFTYTGTDAALFPNLRYSSAFSFEWFSLYFLTRSGHWGASLALVSRDYNYGLPRNIQVEPATDRLSYRLSDTSYKKVQLSGTYWGVPLLIHWMGGRKGLRGSKGVYAAVGGEVLFLGNTSLHYYDPDYEIYDRRDFPLNPIRVNALLRLGYGNFYGHAAYSITPIYRSNIGVPDFNLLTVGLGFRF